MWPSPCPMEYWIKQTWKPKMKGEICFYACRNVFFAFLFELKEELDVIFRNNPYILVLSGMYLNQWYPDFNLDEDISMTIPIQVKLPCLPLSLWSDDQLRAVGNRVGKYLDRDDPKGSQFASSKTCVQVDLEKGLPLEIMLTLGGQNYFQTLDYEQILSTCRHYQEYGHFTKDCKKSTSG